MFYKLKAIVVFLKCISNILLLRNFGNIIYDLSAKYEGVLSISHLRKLEKVSKKVRKAELDIQFLKNCLTFSVAPKFLCFPLPGTEGHDVKAIRQRLLRSAIKRRQREYRKLVFERDKIHKEIKGILTSIELYVVEKAIRRNVKDEERKTAVIHEKKLKSLTKNEALPFSARDTIHNISSYRLTPDEEEVLKHGLTHSIVPPRIRKSDIFTCFEMIHRSMLGKLIDSRNASKLRSDLSHLAHLYVSSHRISASDVKTHRILKGLRNNEQIVILRADKGNFVVIINNDDYRKGIVDILSDTSKFKKLRTDPTLTREGKLQRFLRELKTKGKLDNDIYSKIYPTGSQPARIYGLPKIHKLKVPNTMPTFRPIVSSIRTYNYELSKYLCSILQPCIPNEYTTADTFSFVSELKNIATSNKFMVSFDVNSLFTNIPLNESIDLAVSYILQNNSNLKLSKEDLTKLFSFATAQTHFLFNGSTYDQVDGVSMGSPLAPVLANLFMGHHEKIWLENFDNSKVLFYRRYVDDTFCLFNSEHDALSFFNFLNKQHPNITFSMKRKLATN